MIEISYLFLFILLNVSAVAFLWIYTPFNTYLRRLLFLELLFCLVFSGHIVQLNNISFNVRYMFVINYFTIAFVLINLYGIQEYHRIIKEHFQTLMIIVITLFPIYLLHTRGVILPDILIHNENLIRSILDERFNYFFVICFSFYVGQILYMYSFEIQPQKSFYYEFLLRIPIFMVFQSFLFYIGQTFLIHQKLVDADIGMLQKNFFNILLTGFIVKYTILLICAKPYQLIYQYKAKENNERTITV